MSDQNALFEKGASWEEAWREMPEFVQEDLQPVKSISAEFATMDDYRAFAELVGQSLTPNTRSIWYPEAEIGRMVDKKYADVPESTRPDPPGVNNYGMRLLKLDSSGRWVEVSSPWEKVS